MTTTYTKAFVAKQYIEPSEWAAEYHDVFETLDGATAKARSRAWRDGKDQAVYQLIAVVEKPDMVNTAKVTTID